VIIVSAFMCMLLGCSANEPTAESQAVLRIFDVRDLVVSLDDKVDIKLSEAHGDEMPPMLEEDEEDGMTFEALIARVRKVVSSGDWDTAPNLLCHRQGNLGIRNRPDVVNQVQSLIERLRKSNHGEGK
jgi:hypothetical protein